MSEHALHATQYIKQNLPKVNFVTSAENLNLVDVDASKWLFTQGVILKLLTTNL